MLRGVLFDLDGTLLDIDLEGFLSEYFAALGPVVASVVGADASTESALQAVVEATNAMYRSHPGETNQATFNRVFAETTGARLDEESAADAVDRFYRETFPSLQGAHGPREGARDAVVAAKARGFEVVLATNPIFPRTAIVERLRWAGFDPSEFAAITSYETMESCKPMPTYFRQAARMAGLSPSECLMVGDDPVLDAAAADVGMRVFYVGAPPVPAVDWSGSMRELTSLLERLEGPGRS